MRVWFSGPRVLGIRPGISLRPSEAAGLLREVWSVLKWAGVAVVLLYAIGATMSDRPSRGREYCDSHPYDSLCKD